MRKRHNEESKILMIIAVVAIVLSIAISILYKLCNPSLGILQQFIEFPAPTIVVAMSLILIRISNEITRD